MTVVLKNSKLFVFDDFIIYVLTAMGLTSAALAMVWAEPSQNDNSTNSTNPLRKPLAHLARDLYKQQLLPGNRLEALSTKVRCCYEFIIWRTASSD